MALSFQTSGQTLVVTRDGAPLTTYWFGKENFKPHFWPIIGPHGAAVTRQFPHVGDSKDEPHDHPHHRGLSFTHGEVHLVNQPWIDFWAEDAKAQGRIVHEGFESAPAVNGAALEFTSRHRWVAPDGKALLEDLTAWRITELGNGAALFTARVALKTAGEAVTFGDTKEGTFSVRIATSMDEQQEATGPRSTQPRGRITNSEGDVGEGECWGQQADWVDYAGTVSGRRVSVSMFDHPDNQPRAFWHVRAYGLFSANPFGSRSFGQNNSAHELELGPGQELVLRYGLLVHAAESRDATAKAYHDFVAAMR